MWNNCNFLQLLRLKLFERVLPFHASSCIVLLTLISNLSLLARELLQQLKTCLWFDRVFLGFLLPLFCFFRADTFCWNHLQNAMWDGKRITDRHTSHSKLPDSTYAGNPSLTRLPAALKECVISQHPWRLPKTGVYPWHIVVRVLVNSPKLTNNALQCVGSQSEIIHLERSCSWRRLETLTGTIQTDGMMAGWWRHEGGMMAGWIDTRFSL